MPSLKEIEEAAIKAKELNEELGYLEDAFTSIGQKIKDEVEYNLIGVTEETKKIGEIFSKNLNSAIKQNAASLKEITKLQDQIGKGVNVEAKIQKELEKIATRKKTIARQQNNLLANGITINEDLSKQLNAQFSIQEDTLNTLTEQNTERQKEKSLLTLLGEGGANLLDQLDKSGTASKLMKLNLKDTVTPMRLMEVAIGFIVDAFISLDTTTEKVAQNLGISFHEAAGMNKQFSQIAQDSNNIFVTTKGIAEAQIQLSAALGTNAMFSAEMLQTQTELTTQLKLSEGTSAEIAKLGLLTGKTSKEIAANVMGQSVAMNAANGTALTEKAILEEVANLSSSIQLSMANNPIELAKAVQTAKQFGMELSSVDGIAGGLLNFEQSIASELEAEVLLGKNINLEKARQAALNNDLATVAEEIAKQAGSAAEFTAMNRIQQEALAKAVGMSREDLAKSLQSREILAKLGGQDADMQAAYNRLKAEGNSQEEIAAKLGDKQLANSLHSENIQGQFTASVAKMKELFVQVAAALIPIVEPIAAVVGYMANLISKSMGFLKVLGSIAVAMKVIQFLGNEVYRQKILTNVASKLGLITETEKGVIESRNGLIGNRILNIKKQKARFDKNSVLNKVKENILGKVGLTQEVRAKAFAKIKEAYQNKTLLSLLKEQALKAAIFLKEGAINILKGIGVTLGITQVSLEKSKLAGIFRTIGGLTVQLGVQLGLLSASLATNAAVTFGVGVAVAIAAALAGYAMIKSMTGNDVMSPGNNTSGYGNRTLMGPEGAIALNNKDTVIAGTDLFPKGNDVVSGPAGSVNMTPDNSRMEKLLERAINRPDPVIEMNGDRLGTAVGKYSYSTQ